MPTRNRRRFVGQSIRYFLRQDYPERELIIVDDGEDAVVDLVPEDRRIRYLRLDQRTSVGAKRNLACEASAGDLIAHWDDDDWMAPTRLSLQVSALLDSGAQACGARDLLHYRLEQGDAWLYQPRPHELETAGCTLLYRRATWAKQHFRDINVGEDSAFMSGIPREQVQALPDASFYVALIHSHNTSSKHLTDARWHRRPLDEVTRRLALDRDFYVGLRSGTPEHAASTRRPVQVPITISASFAVAGGYGSMSEYLVLGILRAGARVQVAAVDIDPTGLSPELLATMERRSSSEGDGPVLFFNWVRPELTRYRASSSLFINTMWESDRLPAGWADELNRAQVVIVPTRFVARTCRQSGVVRPIEVVPEGIDPEVYHYLERPEHPGLTTLIVGPVDERKNTRCGIAAWKQAFADDPDARLILKSHYRYHNYKPDDPRIEYVDQIDSTRGIAHWYAQADVLLALGNEGFGLPLVEGMATGLPVIALDSEGQSDVCDEAREYILPVAAVAREAYWHTAFGDCGTRGVPDVNAIASQLRWVDTHRAEARALGRAGSRWAIHNRNIWDKGPRVLDLVEQHAEPKVTLRRRRTVWVPSWRTPCGIAEYSAQLLDSDVASRLSPIRLT